MICNAKVADVLFSRLLKRRVKELLWATDHAWKLTHKLGELSRRLASLVETQILHYILYSVMFKKKFFVCSNIFTVFKAFVVVVGCMDVPVLYSDIFSLIFRTAHYINEP